MTKLFRVFLLLSVVFLWRAEMFAQAAPSAEAGPKGSTPKLAQATEAIWDVLLNVDITAGGSAANAGVVYVPSLNKFWVSKWSSQRWYTINPDGTRADSFVVAGVGTATSSARAMTSDGQFVYMAVNSATIYKVDPATRTVAATITSAAPANSVRFLSYDATLNSGAGGFWVGNFSTPIRKISMTGAVLSDSLSYLTLGSASNYGIAIDRVSPGGPFLWCWGQGAGAGTPQRIVQVNATTGLPTGVSHDVLTDVGVGNASAIAGGITVSATFNPTKLVLAGVLQGTPDKLFAYEIATLGPLPGPGLATNPSPADNATGININLNPDLTWTNPTGTVFNKVYFSTNLSDVTTQAPAALVFNGRPSTIAVNYNQAANLNYATKYYWRVIEHGATDSTPGTVWSFTTLPAPAPKPATNVAAVYTPADTSANISWVNPTQNINNGPITVDSVVIWRGTVRVGRVVGSTTLTYKDRKPPNGIHVYAVVAWAGGLGSVPAPANPIAAGLFINTYSRNLNGQIIPDNDPNGLNDVINISAPPAATVAKVILRIDSLTHTWDADLDLSLIAPNGTVLDLCSDNGSQGDHFFNTVLDDDATVSITTGVAPFTGIFNPEVAFSGLNGIAANGAWTVKFVDDAAQDTGNVWKYTLVILTTAQVPVELTSFTANAVGKTVELNWVTATELNNQGFEVQRKATGSDWKQVGYITGKGTTTQENRYKFTDENVSFGSYEYRLRQIDFGGAFQYSPVINADVTAPAEFSLSQNYPNPFNPSTSISFTLAVDAAVSLKLYNALGQEVRVLLSANMKQGAQKFSFDAQGLTSGIYFYKLEAKGVDGKNFSQMRKMILMK